MDYELTKPCKNCPFRTDCLKGWLGEDRAEEIVNGGEFACHETTTFDDEGEPIESDKDKHCAGFLILLEKVQKPHQMMRICERLVFYDLRNLNMGSPVFDTAEDFVAHHGAKRTKRRRRGSRATTTPTGA